MSADLAVKLQLYGNIYLLLMSGFGMFLGLFAVFARKRKAIYLYFTVLALISSFLSRLFYTLMIAFLYNKVKQKSGIIEGALWIGHRPFQH